MDSSALNQMVISLFHESQQTPAATDDFNGSVEQAKGQALTEQK